MEERLKSLIAMWHGSVFQLKAQLEKKPDSWYLKAMIDQRLEMITKWRAELDALRKQRGDFTTQEEF